MKYIYFLPLWFAFFSGCAQDTLFLKNHTYYAVTVTGISEEAVMFQKWNKPHSPIYSMPMKTLLHITYSTDSVEECDVLPPLLKNATYVVHSGKWDACNYNQGEYDAAMNYEPETRNIGQSFAGSLLLGPVLGIIPAATIAYSHKPGKRLVNPDELSIKNDSYYAGYIHQAHRKKASYAWMGYGLAVATEAFIGSIVLGIATGTGISIP